MNGWVWVDEMAKVKRFREETARAAVLGVDTEYDSFRYFREKLCLVQICVKGVTYLFDPLGPMDLAFLGDIFADATLVKVLHAGDNDIRILRRDYDFTFRNVFDTYRAAALLRQAQLSLANLIQDLLGMELRKERRIQRSQWDHRPLSPDQINYAVRDVVYLEELYARLDGLLREGDLREEADRAFWEVAGATWQERTFDVWGFMRIPGLERLSDRQRDRLQRLYQWRFNKAKETDRAVFMVMSDEELLRLAETDIGDPELLTAVGALSEKKAARYGREIMAILGFTS